MLDIYLNTIMPGEEIDGEQEDALLDIAYDCILHGGSAVEEARAILELDINDSCAGNESRLASTANIPLKHKKGDGYFNFHPNPAHDYINASYNFDSANGAILKITEVTGRIVKEIKLPYGSKSLKIDTGDFSTGIYIYQVKSDDGMKKSGKFVIQ